jgi:RNA polymerase sigma factor (sigma-70 family)
METAALVVEKAERRKIFEELYESTFPPVAYFVKSMNGSFQDAKDIFQDALVIFWEKSTDKSFIITTSPEAYILGIAKHLWIRKFNALKKVSMNEMERAISIPDENTLTPDGNRLLQLLENTGKKCMDLLRTFYYEKLSMKDIATALGYRNERSATVQKYKCIEKIRSTIHKTSLAYDDFME